MNTKQIKKLLIDRDLTVSELARLINKSRPWTSNVLYGHRTSHATRHDIARVLHLKPEDIWPNHSERKVA